MLTTAEPDIESLLADHSFVQNPYPVYHRLLREAPVWTTPTGEKVFFRFDDVYSILRDQDRFGQAIRQHKHPAFVGLDPPDHTRLRGLVSRAFTPRAIRRLQDDIVRASEELMARLRPQGQMELVDAYARPVPTRMITDMLGIPLVDADRWEVWANTIHRATSAIQYLPDQRAAAEELRLAAVAASEMEAEYFAEVIARRKAEPPRDDILGALMQAEEAGDRLSDVELRYTLVLLLGAGHSTSVSLLANGTHALLTNPDQLVLLREDRSLIPAAIEEMIRWDGIVQVGRRRVRRDTTVSGVPLREGDLVMIVLGAANRDPAMFEDPDRFDITRANVNRHVGFGFGIHHCLGANLARAEIGVALDALLDLPGLQLADREPPDYGSAYGLRGIERLALGWNA